MAMNIFMGVCTTIEGCPYLHSNSGLNPFDCFELPWQASDCIQFRRSTFYTKINWCQYDYFRSYGIASERNWCEWRPHAATRRKQYLFMRQFYVGKRLMESKYTMMAIDSNRILFHAIANVILCELFIFFWAFFCIVISVTFTQTIHCMLTVSLE